MTFIIGHRGAKNLWPENSLTGFHNLIKLGVDGVEFDVHLTKHGELLVMHDATLERTARASGLVADLEREAHRQIQLKDSSDVIPTLDEVLAIFADTGMELHLELKMDINGVPYEGLEALAIEAIERHGLAKQSFLTSFSVDVLARIRNNTSNIRTLNSFHRPGVVADGLAEGLRKREAVADVIAIERSVLEEHWDTVIAQVPLSRLGAWVPNEIADLERWMNCGLRQVTTDNPDNALAVLNANKPE